MPSIQGNKGPIVGIVLIMCGYQYSISCGTDRKINLFTSRQKTGGKAGKLAGTTNWQGASLSGSRREKLLIDLIYVLRCVIP